MKTEEEEECRAREGRSEAAGTEGRSFFFGGCVSECIEVGY